MKTYNRKEFAEKLDIGAETLRYYENKKLITLPKRDKNGYRKYSDESLSEINFILKLKKYGFSLSEISGLMKLIKNEKDLTKDKIKKVLSEKIDEINDKIGRLKELKVLLSDLKESGILGECDTFKSYLKLIK